MEWYHWLLLVLTAGAAGWLGFQLGSYITRLRIRAAGQPPLPGAVEEAPEPPATPQPPDTEPGAALGTRADMVLVQAGSFHLSSSEQGQTGSYYIDKYPVSNREYLDYIEKTKNPNVPEHLRSLSSEEFNQPIVWVSRWEAEGYARWVGKRLPTEAEWVRAARGDQDARNYPWGDTFSPVGKAVYGESRRGHPAEIADRGKTPHGCFDMVGNAWEWTAESVLRGGFYGSRDVGVEMVLRMDPDAKSGATGFRCALDA